MTWSLFWYIKTGIAWGIAAWGAVDWGEQQLGRYLFILSLAVALSAISAGRLSRDNSRRQAYDAGWEARDVLGRPGGDVHRFTLRK